MRRTYRKRTLSSQLLIAALLGAWGVCSANANDVSDSTLSDDVVQKIDSELMKTYGKDITLTQTTTQILGLAKQGEVFVVRQLSANSDPKPAQNHFFNRPKNGSGEMIFFYQDKAANSSGGYRTDAGFHYLSGYVERGTAVPTTAEEGALGLKAEIVWWNRTVSAFIYDENGKKAEAKGSYAGALADFNDALEIDPEDADTAYDNIAWLLATCPDADFRDGPKAVDYATKACKMLSWTDSSKVSTLAAACAEAGQFDAAIKWENQYLQFPKLSDADVATAKKRLELYTAHKAFHADK